jgi:hypothetical protein
MSPDTARARRSPSHVAPIPAAWRPRLVPNRLAVSLEWRCPHQQFRPEDWHIDPLPRLRREPPLGEPQALRALERALENAVWLRSLADDYDGEGSIVVAESTWERAARFLRDHAEWCWKSWQVAIAPPDIAPGPEGSIDLHWIVPTAEILVNVPADPSALLQFYADSPQGHHLKGTLHDAADANHAFCGWLRQLTS